MILDADWSKMTMQESHGYAHTHWCPYTLMAKKMQHSRLSSHTVTDVLVRKTQIVTHTKETNLTLVTDSNHGCKSNETCTSIIRSPASLMKQTEHQKVNSDSCCVIRETIMGSQLK